MIFKNLIILFLLLLPIFVGAVIPDEESVEKILKAISTSDYESVKKYIKEMDDEAINVETPNGSNFLHHALDQVFKSARSNYSDNKYSTKLKEKDILILDYLIDRGADLSARNIRGHNAVLDALEKSINKNDTGLNFVKKLIENGGNINSTDYEGNNAFHHLANTHNSKAALRQAQIKNQHTKKTTPQTLPRLKLDTSSFINLFIEIGVDVNAKNISDVTPLMIFISSKADIAIINQLVKAGSRTDETDSNGNTLIHLAIQEKLSWASYIDDYEIQKQIVGLLVENDVSINTRNKRSRSPLSNVIERVTDYEKAILKNKKRILKLEEKENIKERDIKKLDKLKENHKSLLTRLDKQWELAEYLVKLGADTNINSGIAGKAILIADIIRIKKENPTQLVSEVLSPKDKELARLKKEKKIRKKTIKPKCSLKDKTFIENAKVFAVGGHKGNDIDHQIDNSGSEAGIIEVTVNYDEAPVILMLGAYYPTIWNIKRTEPTNIIAILASGYHRQAVAGISETVDVTESNITNKQPCGSFSSLRGKEPKHIHGNSKLFFKRDISKFYPVADAKVHVGKPLSSNSRLIESKSTTVESYYIKESELSGPASLDYSEKIGLIRKANQNDVEAWHEVLAEKYGHNKIYKKDKKGIRQKPTMSLHRTYVILKNFTLPEGLYGGNSAIFFVPKNVPFPKGDPGHSPIYDFNTVECKGMICAH